MIDTPHSKLETKMETVINCYMKAEILPAEECDVILQEYTKLLTDIRSNEKLYLRFQKYDRITNSLDTFYVSVIGHNDKYKNLEHFLTAFFFCLSHGQARVESGFSINNDVMKQNMKEKAVIVHRFVKDTIKSFPYNNDIQKIPITVDLVRCVKNSKAWYDAALAAEKEKESNIIDAGDQEDEDPMVLLEALEEKLKSAESLIL